MKKFLLGIVLALLLVPMGEVAAVPCHPNPYVYDISKRPIKFDEGGWLVQVIALRGTVSTKTLNELLDNLGDQAKLAKEVFGEAFTNARKSAIAIAVGLNIEAGSTENTHLKEAKKLFPNSSHPFTFRKKMVKEKNTEEKEVWNEYWTVTTDDPPIAKKGDMSGGKIAKDIVTHLNKFFKDEFAKKTERYLKFEKVLAKAGLNETKAFVNDCRELKIETDNILKNQTIIKGKTKSIPLSLTGDLKGDYRYYKQENVKWTATFKNEKGGEIKSGDENLEVFFTKKGEGLSVDVVITVKGTPTEKIVETIKFTAEDTIMDEWIKPGGVKFAETDKEKSGLMDSFSVTFTVEADVPEAPGVATTDDEKITKTEETTGMDRENVLAKGIMGWDVPVGDYRPKYMPGTRTPLTGGPSDITRFIQKIIAKVLLFLAALAVFMITWNALDMVLAVGDTEKISKAKKGLTWSLVGLALAIFAYIIVKSIISLTYIV